MTFTANNNSSFHGTKNEAIHTKPTVLDFLVFFTSSIFDFVEKKQCYNKQGSF
jgi:hypothetical protein